MNKSLLKWQLRIFFAISVLFYHELWLHSFEWDLKSSKYENLRWDQNKTNIGIFFFLSINYSWNGLESAMFVNCFSFSLCSYFTRLIAKIKQKYKNIKQIIKIRYLKSRKFK